MAHTAQTGINNLRVLLSEVDSNNSRWQDAAHLLTYLNLGRRRFSRESQSVKAIFERTTVAGVTLGSRYSSYILDPTILFIDSVWYDDVEIEAAADNEWDEWVQGDPSTQGFPEIYRRVGDSIDLWPCVNGAKLLQIYASTLTTDLVAVTSAENELNEDKVWGAVYFAAMQALTDDNRDGTLYEANGLRIAKDWKKANHRSGPRYVESTESRTWRT